MSANLCQNCDNMCGECSGSLINNCTSCKGKLILSSNSRCVCNSESYLDLSDPSSYTCSICNNLCEECSGPLSNNCASCKNNLILSSNNTCVCSSGHYLNLINPSNYSCGICDASCAECFGPSSQECIACQTGQVLVNGQCLNSRCSANCKSCVGVSDTECTSCMIEFTLLEVKDAQGRCLSQCPSLYYAIQLVGGETICKSKTKIINRLIHGSSSNEFKILMSGSSQYDYNTVISNITLSLGFINDQPSITYTYSFRLSSDQTYISLTLEFSSHLLPGSILTLSFDDSKEDNTTTYYLQNQVQTLTLDEIYIYSSSTKTAINIGSQVNSVANKANSVISWTSSFMASSVHSMRSQIVEDMLAYFIYMNIQFPPNFVAFELNNQSPLNFFMPNLMGSLITKLTQVSRALSGDSTEFDTNSNANLGFALNRYAPDRDFLIAFGSTITVFILAFFGLLILIGIRGIWPKHAQLKKSYLRHKSWKLLDYLSYTLQWNFMINQYISVYIDLVFSSLLQIMNGRKKDSIGSFQYISAIFGIILSCVGIFAIIYLCKCMIQNFNKPQSGGKDQDSKSRNYLKRVEILHEPFRAEKFQNLLYPFALLLRSFFFVILLVVCYKTPILQAFYIFFATIVVIVYLIYYKPLKSKSQQILTLIYESLFLLACSSTIGLHIFNQKHLADIETRSRLGFLIYACSFSMSVLDIISVIIEVVKTVKDFRLKTRKNKTPSVSPLKLKPFDFSSALMQSMSPSSFGGINNRDGEAISSPNLISPQKILERRKKSNFIRKITINDDASPSSPAKGVKEVSIVLAKTVSKELVSSNLKILNESGDASPSMMLSSTKRIQFARKRSIYTFDQDGQNKNNDNNYLNQPSSILLETRFKGSSRNLLRPSPSLNTRRFGLRSEMMISSRNVLISPKMVPDQKPFFKESYRVDHANHLGCRTEIPKKDT